MDYFRSQIAAGILAQGEKLPSVRELASQLSINPNTIQRAYRELEQLGLVRTIPGKGCFVCGTDSADQDWETLDHAVKKLLSQGVRRSEILEHISKGG